MTMRLFAAVLLVAFTFTKAAIVRETLVIEEWVVDYLRPTADVHGRWPWETEATRKTPFKIDDALRATQ